MFKLMFGLIAAVIIIGVNIYVRRKPETTEETERIEDDRFNFQP